MASPIRLLAAAALLALGVGSFGCSDDKKNPTTPEPPPEVPTVVSSFDGQVAERSIDCNNFSMSNDGNIEITITDLQPLTTITMGLSLGQQDASLPTGCATFVEDNTVRLSQTLASNALLAGNYCVCIFDVGNIFPGEIVDYSLDVMHPQ